MAEAPILHIHPQDSYHADAVIVGNRAGLEALKAALEKALSAGAAMADVMVADGEHYDLFLLLKDGDHRSECWIEAARPYVADWAAEKRTDAVWPHDEAYKKTKEQA